MIRYPCDFIDKGALALTDNARGCSVTPTWQLVVRGALDPAHVRAALADCAARFPSLRCKVRAIDHPDEPLAARHFEYVEDPTFSVDGIFRVVDGADLAELTRHEQNRPLDPFRDFTVTLTMARDGDGWRLFFRQHHAIADGRAFIGLLGEFAAFVEAHRAGRAGTALVPVHRKDELAPLALSRSRRFSWRLLGYIDLIRRIFAALFRPVVPLLQNAGNDYTGDNGTVHWIVDDSVLATWNAARKRIGVSLNSMLTAALFTATQRVQRAHGAPVGRTAATLAVETRPREGDFASFANHLSSIDIILPLDRIDDPTAMARTIQAQVDRARRANQPFKRLIAERAIVLGMPLRQMQQMIFEAKRMTYNFGFSNLIALDFPTLGGDGWRVDNVLITTPIAPRQGIGLTVIRYNGRVTFNFNYKSSASSRADAEELARSFAAVVDELVQRP
ncbi:MAG TPA: WS/DGAT domain-containing protein [Polyangia bacterium]